MNGVLSFKFPDEVAEFLQPLRLRVHLGLINPHLGLGPRLAAAFRPGLQGINVLVVALQILVLPGHIFGCTREYALSC